MFSGLIIKNIIVLSQPNYGNKIIASLKRHSPSSSFLLICDPSELNLISVNSLKDSRIISFSSKIIVPERVLNHLGYGAYNVHPGPPNFPGWAPFSFALYKNVKNYGVSLHKMSKIVDSGDIVAVNPFFLDSHFVQAELENICLSECLNMIEEWAPQLVRSPPLNPIPIQWSGVRTTQKDFKAMCLIDEKISRGEFHRRLKAFGNGDGKYHLHIKLLDRVYKLDPSKDQNKIKEYISIHGVRFELQHER